MTLNSLFKAGEKILTDAGVDNASNEARWLIENDFNVAGRFVLCRDREISDRESEKYLSRVQERANGRPIQYIIGHWDFYGREFVTGEGVLIPRPETEMLVDFALETLKNKKNSVVVDLCSGTGCIGLTIAAERPDAKVYLVEKFDEAFAYLKENARVIAPDNTTLIQADILDESFRIPESDLVLSNPPYIRKNEISYLQSEVLREPVTALDGGEDGLVFYKAIANLCSCTLAVECGENQAEDICNIFGSAYALKDFNNIERIVVRNVI